MKLGAAEALTLAADTSINRYSRSAVAVKSVIVTKLAALAHHYAVLTLSIIFGNLRMGTDFWDLGM